MGADLERFTARPDVLEAAAERAQRSLEALGALLGGVADLGLELPPLIRDRIVYCEQIRADERHEQYHEAIVDAVILRAMLEP